MTTTDCPPLPVRITKSLLGYGAIAGPIYVLAVAWQIATRDGFDPTRHAASQLANGEWGWIQIATFVVTGAMTVAAAVGVRRALGPGGLSAWGVRDPRRGHHDGLQRAAEQSSRHREPGRAVSRGRGPRVAGVLLDLDRVEPRPHGHQFCRRRAIAGWPALPLKASSAE